jgi:beta-galactosidase
VPYLSEEYLAKARAFVEAGGIWIAGPLTGGRTGEHTVPTDAALGQLEALAGVETLFTYPLSDTGTAGSAFGHAAPLAWWAAAFLPKGARVVGTLEGGVTPGLAFITEHAVGQGKIVLIGAMPQGDDGAALLRALVRHYAAEAGITPVEATPGTVVFPRASADGPLWIVVNMDGHGGTVTLPVAGLDLLSKETLPAGALEIGAYGWRVIQMTV